MTGAYSSPHNHYIVKNDAAGGAERRTHGAVRRQDPPLVTHQSSGGPDPGNGEVLRRLSHLPADGVHELYHPSPANRLEGWKREELSQSQHGRPGLAA